MSLPPLGSAGAGQAWPRAGPGCSLRGAGRWTGVRLSVIVPNYIGGTNNCWASTGLHDVCCISECEALTGELEREIAAPAAPSTQVAGDVSQISSSSVDGPRNLMHPFLCRLNEVASRNGGSVLFHGRLFARRMHHAFRHRGSAASSKAPGCTTRGAMLFSRQCS